MGRTGTRIAGCGLLLLITGCGLLLQDPAGEDRGNRTGVGADGDGMVADTTDLPVRAGTLSQHEISVYLRRGDLQMRITPLAESVTRVPPPDTYERLSALASGHQRIFRERTGTAVAFQLFLVAVHSESVQSAFEPEDVNLVSRGLRYRPVDIRPVTPRWTRHRVGPQETLMAVYAFPAEVDLESSLEVEYQEIRDRSWERILPQVQAERFRVRARAGGGSFP
jgi:hypothetical protein